MPWASAPRRSPAPIRRATLAVRAVGQEDAQPDHGLQHHGRDALARELRGAEVAHDRGVREQEQRLGHQRQEGGYGEPQDLAVVGPGHGPSLVYPAARIRWKLRPPRRKVAATAAGSSCSARASGSQTHGRTWVRSTAYAAGSAS